MQKLVQTQLLPVSLEKAWDFFTNPANLNEITPADFRLESTAPLPPKIYAGLFIEYKLRLFAIFPATWVTEITHVQPNAYFVDEQRMGPFRLWHHEHHFTAVANGTEMTDILHYDIGKSIFGWLAGQLWVHRQIRQLFAHRLLILKKQFEH